MTYKASRARRAIMGWLDGLRGLFGLGAETAASRAASPDDLFGMSTAYITMAADLDYKPIATGALCFADIDSTDFADAVGEAREIVEVGTAQSVAVVHEDAYGYEWVVVEDDDFEELVVGMHAAADEFISRGYGARLLAAVFGFVREDETVYWIYSFRRGAFYPFAPAGDRNRDHGLEFKLRSVLDGELVVESDESFWYPLWPDDPDGHPWE